jgi:hypothetical protein
MGRPQIPRLKFKTALRLQAGHFSLLRWPPAS